MGKFGEFLKDGGIAGWTKDKIKDSLGIGKGAGAPGAPDYYQNPIVNENINWASGIGKQLTRLDLTGDLSNLSPLIQNDPEVTKLALQYAQQSLTPAWNDTIRNIRNEAANSGALTSSTFTDAITGAGQDLQSQFQAITTQAALADRERALSNMMTLSGTGINTVNAATGMAQDEQNAQNQFNLQNFENQLAEWQLNKESNGLGAIGTALGGIGGFMVGGPAGAMTGASLGGMIGGTLEGGTGGATAINSGASSMGTMYGLGMYNPNTRSVMPTATSAGMTASNNPFAGFNMNSGLNSTSATSGTRWLA